MIIWIEIVFLTLVLLDLDDRCDALFTKGALVPSGAASNNTRHQVGLILVQALAPGPLERQPEEELLLGLWQRIRVGGWRAIDDRGGDAEVRLEPYHDSVRPLSTVALPRAYVVPASCPGVIGLLERHGVTMQRVGAARTVDAWRYTIESMGSAVLEEQELADPVARLERTTALLGPGDAVVPSDQLHGMAIGTLLEPASMWHLSRYAQHGSLLRSGEYPILRLVD